MSGREDSGGGGLQPEGNSESKQDVLSWAQADVVGSRSSKTENLRARIFNGRRETAVKVEIGARAGKQGEGKSEGHAGPGRLPGSGSTWRLGSAEQPQCAMMDCSRNRLHITFRSPAPELQNAGCSGSVVRYPDLAPPL